MFQASRRVEYALRAVLYLARHQAKGPQSFQKIADAEDIPGEYLAKILRTLRDADIIRSKRGAAGGYELARAPEDLSFLDVIEAAEERVAINLCSEHGIGCSQASSCAMASVWRAGERAMLDVFRRTRISDLVCAPLNLVHLEAESLLRATSNAAGA